MERLSRFPFVLLPEEHRQMHFHGIDTVKSRSFVLFAKFFNLLDCSWSDLLFVSAMIKPFEFIKVSSVCTVPNARNTRGSTALGGTPRIWYCAWHPEPSDPTAVSVSVGCGCGTQRGSVRCCTQCHFFSTVCCMHSSNSCFFLFAEFSPTVSVGLEAWKESQVSKEGASLFFFKFFF